MFCFRLGRLRRRNLRVSRLGASWARRTVIQNATRNLAPRKNGSTANISTDAVSCSFGRTQDTDYAVANIFRLEHFERFVFVMSVLERYSDQDCSVPLGCSRQDVGEIRIRVLPHVAEADRLRTMAKFASVSSDSEDTQTQEAQSEPQF